MRPGFWFILFLAACTTTQQQAAGFQSIEGVAAAAKAAQGAFGAWDLQHQRLLERNTAALEAYRKLQGHVYMMDLVLKVSLEEAERLIADNPKTDPMIFMANVFHALGALMQAISVAEGKVPSP